MRFFFRLFLLSFFPSFLPSKYCCNWACLASVGPDLHVVVMQNLLHTNHAATIKDLYQARNLDFRRININLQLQGEMQEGRRNCQVKQMGKGKI